MHRVTEFIISPRHRSNTTAPTAAPSVQRGLRTRAVLTAQLQPELQAAVASGWVSMTDFMPLAGPIWNFGTLWYHIWFKFIVHSLWYHISWYLISYDYHIIVMWYHNFYDIIVSMISHALWYHSIIVSMISHALWYHRNYDIIYYYILYHIIYDGCIGLLPRLHSGLDSFRFSTITIVQLTIHCMQHYTAQSVSFCCGLLPNTTLCCPGTAHSRSGARFGAALASNSGWNALLIKWKISTAAAINGGFGVCFLGVVGGCRESLLGEQWNVVVVTNIQHMQTKLSETTRCKNSIQISKQSRPRTNRAAHTIDDYRRKRSAVGSWDGFGCFHTNEGLRSRQRNWQCVWAFLSSKGYELKDLHWIPFPTSNGWTESLEKLTSLPYFGAVGCLGLVVYSLLHFVVPMLKLTDVKRCRFVRQMDYVAECKGDRWC